jgi:hypothetical protein
MRRTIGDAVGPTWWGLALAVGLYLAISEMLGDWNWLFSWM